MTMNHIAPTSGTVAANPHANHCRRRRAKSGCVVPVRSASSAARRCFQLQRNQHCHPDCAGNEEAQLAPDEPPGRPWPDVRCPQHAVAAHHDEPGAPRGERNVRIDHQALGECGHGEVIRAVRVELPCRRYGDVAHKQDDAQQVQKKEGRMGLGRYRNMDGQIATSKPVHPTNAEVAPLAMPVVASYSPPQPHYDELGVVSRWRYF